MELWLDVDAAQTAADKFASIADTLHNDIGIAQRTMRNTGDAMFSISVQATTPDGKAAHDLLTKLTVDAAWNVESFTALAVLSLVVEAAATDAAIEAMKTLDAAVEAGFSSAALQQETSREATDGSYTGA